VAAGAVAKKLLLHQGIQTCAYLSAVGNIQMMGHTDDITQLQAATFANPIFCPEKKAADLMMTKIIQAKNNHDSLGGVVAFMACGLPTGLGDPIYDKLEANLAKAMLSIPASKGFELGEGFNAASMSGSSSNDLFISVQNQIKTRTNHAGGTLGGISTGMPLWGRVAFKPTSSIKQEQETLNTDGLKTTLKLPAESRHDPCVAIRAVPVVDSMCALVLADALLMNRCSRL
jgi:chorismate synthase